MEEPVQTVTDSSSVPSVPGDLSSDILVRHSNIALLVTDSPVGLRRLSNWRLFEAHHIAQSTDGTGHILPREEIDDTWTVGGLGISPPEG